MIPTEQNARASQTPPVGATRSCALINLTVELVEEFLRDQRRVPGHQTLDFLAAFGPSHVPEGAPQFLVGFYFTPAHGKRT